MLTLVRNLSVRIKLLLMVVPPLVGMLVYAGLSTRNDLQLYTDLQFQQQLVDARMQLNITASEYQKLRSSLMLDGSSSDQQLQASLSKLISLTKSLPQDLHPYLNGLDLLAKQASQNKIDLAGLLNSSSALATLGLRLELYSNQLAGYSNGLTTRSHSAHHALMLAVSRLHEEQLIMAQAFTASYFPTGAYPRFVRLLSEQSVFFANFNNNLPGSSNLGLKAWQQSDDYQQLTRVRATAEQIYLDGNFGLSTSTQEWMQLTNKLLNNPIEQQDQLLQQLNTQVANQLDSAWQRLLMIGLSNLLLVLTGALITWFIYRQISLPMLRLTHTMEKVADDLNLTRKMALVGEDETAQAARAFDRMLEQVRLLLQQVISATDEVSSSSSLGKRVASNLEGQVQQGQQRLSEMLTSVEELHQAIHGIAANAETSQDASLNASQLAAQGNELIQSLEKNNTALSTSLQNSGNKVNELAEHSAKIDSILEVINAIAEQTNLLALNAAIEAARAGDAGRGFAVVADEVRSLAARSREATIEISQLLDSNRVAADEAVKQMHTSLKQADEVSQQLKQADQSLQQINTAVEGIHSANVETAAAANQQRATADQLSNNATAMNNLYQETTGAVTELENNSQGLESLLTRLEQQLKRFKT
ncbi:methyl-accepting chemotaxis protein [Marinospirillum insulare]|uniref:Methyl-accepting chemotaxis protein n=1 Tax=Marinospirillum insulare TaxID=217169 RepID=A0ABQ5ZR50_9GAMM|nr:methyl-accepting chemotaxis protein [Marinospirillum insulare]GLR62619.1 hypothetical protein GCM10007878_00540 [Marinospirillum insulare]